MRAMTRGSAMVATRRSRPPQSGHARTSRPKVRRSNSAQATWRARRGAGGGARAPAGAGAASDAPGGSGPGAGRAPGPGSAGAGSAGVESAGGGASGGRAAACATRQPAGPPAEYLALLAPGAFVQKGAPPKTTTWKFLDKEADLPGALGLHQVKVVSGRTNKVKQSADGRNQAIPFLANLPVRVRQTLRVGDDCATALLSCDVKRSGRVLRCRSTNLGSPSGAFLDGTEGFR